MNFLNLPFLKRLVPSLRRRTRVFFNRSIFWTKIDGIFYLIDIQAKHDREFYFKKNMKKTILILFLKINSLKNHLYS